MYFKAERKGSKQSRHAVAAFTLPEIMTSLVVIGLVFAGVINGYVQSARRTEWSGYALAAEGLNVQQLEQIRAAKWDTQIATSGDETTNLNLLNWTYSNGKYTGYSYTNLDTPFNSTNRTAVMATNFVTLTLITISTNPAISVKLIQADTVWTFRKKNYTNSIATYRSPDT